MLDAKSGPFRFPLSWYKRFLHTQNTFSQTSKDSSLSWRGTHRFSVPSVGFPLNMKSGYLVAYFVAVALTTIATQGDAQNSTSTPPPPENSTNPAPAQQSLVRPVLPHPHGCDCRGECKKLRHGQVPYKLGVSKKKKKTTGKTSNFEINSKFRFVKYFKINWK